VKLFCATSSTGFFSIKLRLASEQSDMRDSAVLLRVAVLPFETLEAFGAPRSARELQMLLNRRADLDARGAVLTDHLYRIAGARTEGEMPPEAWRARNAVLAVRRDLHNRRPLRQQVLESARSLLGSTASELETLDASVRTWNADRSSWETTFREEVMTERRALLDRLNRVEFTESVWLASRSLHAALEKLPRRDLTAWRNEETHAALKLLAYLIRSATKTSPNALFAATAEASLGPSMQVKGQATPLSVRTRLNVYEARKVVACLSVDPELRPMIRPRTSTTLRSTGDGWSWWRSGSLRHAEDDEVLLEAAQSPILERVVAMAKGRTWPALVEDLARDTGSAPADLERFLHTLVDRGFLVAEVEVPFLEARPLHALADAVRATGIHPSWLPALENIEQSLDVLGPLGSADRRHALLEAGRTLNALPQARPLVEDELFRVDAVSPFRVQIPRDLTRELARAADAYVRVFAALYPFTRRDLYAKFFLDRFPADTPVPALDLYQRLSEPDFNANLGALPRPSGNKSPLDTLERRLLSEKVSEVRLEPKEFLDLVPGTTSDRWMAGALFQLALPPGGTAAEAEARIVLNALFHGSGLALARFHDLHPGDSIARTLRRGWSSLLPEGAVPAEINFMPWGRPANASLRPRLFEHEIELPGDRASEHVTALPLSDLLVRYNSTDHRFHISSRALGGREVVPFLSSGVRPEGFASFLVHVGMQDLVPVAFFPGLDLPDVIHWPRLTLGRVVLFRERWVFGRDLAPEGFSDSPAGWFEHVQVWRRRYHLPRRVFAGSFRHGKPAFFDLESPLMLELFRRFWGSLEENDRCVLSEMLPGPEQLWLRDAAGSYASEFLIQLEGPLSEEGASRE
jgi:lantibiotic biosynthesis dehydratase-like protein